MRKSLAIYSILLLSLLSGKVFAGGDDKGLVNKGDKEFKKAHLAEALGYYLKALAIEPKDCYANFQAGAIYYLTDSARIKSVAYFENTIKYAPANEDTIIDAYYYLGNCYILQKNYKQAILSFQQYLSHLVNDKTDRTIIKEVEHNIEICQSAPTLVQRPPDSASYFIRGSYQPVYVKNLGSLVNSPYPEYSQVTLNHDSTIVFTSRRPTSQNGKKDYMTGYFYEDIFTSHKDTSGQWSPPSLFSNQIHFSPRQLNLASVSLSPDGKTLFIYHKGLIYQSTKNGSAWSEPVRIGKHVKHIKRFMPTVFQSYDGKRLFLVSDKKGGYGGRDIYVCTINTDGTWSDPQNLGPDINTSFDEDAPFLLPDNKTLFFSSNGHKGLGGYDVFKSVYENGKWSVPQNVGAPINSTADDIFFTYDTVLKTGYLSSSRINEGYGDMDLYSFSFTCDNVKNATLLGRIVRDTDKVISSASITLIDSAKQKTSTATSDEHGDYSLQLKPDTKYTLIVKAPNYLSATVRFSTPHQCDQFNLYQLIRIKYMYPLDTGRIHIGQAIQAENAFYRNAQPGYKNISTDYLLSQLAKASHDTAGIWVQENANSLLYTQAQKDSMNPAAIQQVAQVNTTQTVSTNNLSKLPIVRFELNSSNIAQTYYASLDSVAKTMKANTKIRIEIMGYADNTGKEEYNMSLSKARAQTVAKYLVKKGVRSSNIKTEGKGTANPVAPNDGTQNYLNRRAELLIIQ